MLRRRTNCKSKGQRQRVPGLGIARKNPPALTHFISGSLINGRKPFEHPLQHHHSPPISHYVSILEMASRVGFRLSSQFARAARTSTFRKPLGRRFQTTDTSTAPSQSTFQRVWNSPVGVKTVHFWYDYIISGRRQAQLLTQWQGTSNEGTTAIVGH